MGKPREIDALTHVQDVLPTLIELAGLERPENAAFDGVSLAPSLQGAAQDLSERVLVVQYGGIPEKNSDAAVMWNKWRLVGGTELYDVGKDPGQQTNVVAEFPEVTAKMRARYDGWWNELMPAAAAYQPIVVGTQHENPARLSASDWNGVYCDNPPCVRGGMALSGAWSIRVERAGHYRFAMRRWPKESGLYLRDPAPPLHGEYGDLIAGKAMPIAQARLRVGDKEMIKPVSGDDLEIEFETDLAAGDAQLQTWFYDDASELLAGAYYVEVERIER